MFLFGYELMVINCSGVRRQILMQLAGILCADILYFVVACEEA